MEGHGSHGHATMSAARPLEGIEVVDFTRILWGPYATMLLADLDADVTKVERPGADDDTRGWGPPFWRGTSVYFAAVNRGKRSIAIDMGDERGRMAVRELVAGADVVVGNFRPGVTSRLGIADDDVAASNPGLVYASVNAFGSFGPRAQEAGTEVVIEGESGLMTTMGVPDGPPCAWRRDGRHRYGHVARQRCARRAAGMQPHLPRDRFGSGHPSIVPCAAFEARDGWVVLRAVNATIWTKLCTGLGLHP
jgi:crotonobetainyl-CoA:carnitine CoA-transferase CaiB-like acyl-CoA transferase